MKKPAGRGGKKASDEPVEEEAKKPSRGRKKKPESEEDVEEFSPIK